jgi:hypothetical protein
MTRVSQEIVHDGTSRPPVSWICGLEEGQSQRLRDYFATIVFRILKVLHADASLIYQTPDLRHGLTQSVHHVLDGAADLAEPFIAP